MKDWLIFSIITIMGWGVWGFLGKLSTRSINAITVYFLAFLGSFIILPIYFILFHGEIHINFKNMDTVWGILSGITASVASICFYLALKKGESSIVVPLTSLYPVITVLLSILLLQESFTIKKIIGVILAITAAIILGM